jgi:hypothetical protein
MTYFSAPRPLIGHNCRVAVWFRRVAVPVILAPWLVFSSMMPPEHLHEADEHHSGAVTHRHFEAHHHDGAEIDHEGGRIVWLDDSPALLSASHQLTVPGGIVPTHFGACPDLKGWILESILDASPPHGPPRLHASLRAPPSFSA